MAKAAKKVQVSVRLHSEDAAWLHDRAAKDQTTLNATLLQIVEDFRTWWGLDPHLVCLLRADAKALGFNTTGYLYFLLREEVRELLEKKRV